MDRTAVFACVVALLAIGCQGTGKVRADRLALDRIEAVARLHASEESFVVRLNPAPCDCPAFEVQLDGAWYRMFLEPADPDGPVAALRSDLERSAATGNPVERVLVRGKLSKGARLAPTRAPCMILKLLEVCPPSGCTPTP